MSITNSLGRSARHRYRRSLPALGAMVVAGLLAVACGGSASTGSGTASTQIKVGLITKTETNPFFVKMKDGAQQKATELGVQLMTAAGKFDGDNESQVTAIENMTTAGVKGILITPSDTKGIVPAITK